ncbi:MAG: ABC transporter substrate-binding protein, partial [Alphaproteobacteria bacterium]|nr:ABC transporter substrate-binding protein [Alphaproteobacteria bacterium]
MLGRKLLILAGAAALALGVMAGTASAAEKVSLRLNWYLSGLHTPIYLGKERGYFSEEGIDLIIKEGRGSGVATQIIGAKGDTIGLSDAGTMVIAATKGVPIKAIMSILNTSPFGVVSLAETGIKTAKDLEGKRLAVTAGDSLTQLFPAVIKANNLDKSKIKMIFVDPAGKIVSVQ